MAAQSQVSPLPSSPARAPSGLAPLNTQDKTASSINISVHNASPRPSIIPAPRPTESSSAPSSPPRRPSEPPGPPRPLEVNVPASPQPNGIVVSPRTPEPLPASPVSPAPASPRPEPSAALTELRSLLENMDDECAVVLLQEYHLFKRRRQRARVIAEILSTEESFVQQLSQLDSCYMQPLANVLPPKTCEVLFTNVRSIKQMNLEFLQELKGNKSLGTVFLGFAPILQIYHGYAKGTAKAHRMVTQLLATNAKFAECHAKAMDEAKGMNLNSLLITPIQRVPRYKLLLTEVIKFSEDSHPDTAQLKGALEEISKAALLINEAVRKEEHREGLMAVEERFSTKLSLDTPNREFFYEGLLTKVCRRDSKPFTFFLFSDLLVYGVENKATNKVRVSKQIPIDSHFSVKALDNEEQKKLGKPLWAWQIISSIKSFVCFAANEEEFNKWFLKLKDLTASNLSTGAEAPVWTSDKEGMDCTVCHGKFTLTNRRHHCRQCGALVCGGCSMNRAELAMEQGAKVRVCDQCFLKTKEVKEQETVSMSYMQGKKKDPEAIFEGSLVMKLKANESVRGTQKGGVYCVLKTSSFSWYKNEDAIKPTTVIELDASKDSPGATVTREFEGADSKEGFSFQLTAQGKTLWLVCESKTIRDKWVSAITERRKHTDMIPKKDSTSLREGYLYKQGGKVANWKYRYMVLGTQDLCYFKNILDVKPAGTVLLAKGVALAEEPVNKGRVCVFSITPSGSARKWVFSCKTEQERTEWIDAIRQRGSSLQVGHGPTTPPSLSQSPSGAKK